MARRPDHKHGIKRGRIREWPDGVGTPAEVAARISYVGSAQHKTYDSPAGPPAFKADKAKCDRYRREDWPLLRGALRDAILAGSLGEFRGQFPSRAWAWINDVLHEARLTNPATGEYHGFPINDPRQYPEPPERLEAAPRVQIPVV
ncbi:hypothetical protein OJF2_48750 [Aquisphaera giovannonii]|uniref:Uncharacterized protein n=1 Tax=Aquisphaera giovannonii TaxID=406548 RepID=A0A5B9W7V0_9BACT|nr:hypothetical protein [Aquisphaera giovannonii]QEH36314.1 hypothetical protein OJF2_48750 [Aquisphaera giovannonii]